MTGFSADWLTLREPADHAARDAGLTAAFAQAVRKAGAAPRIVDLGAGTGSTFRAISPRLPDARWRLIDHDAALLDRAANLTGAETVERDLTQPLDDVLDGAAGITASALIDLCSTDWIARFVRALPRSAVVLAALNYDGREVWDPASLHEAQGLAAFHAHQRRDKGFGAAAGPDAWMILRDALTAEGWRVRTAQSDWVLRAPKDHPLIKALAHGGAQAVAETGALDATELNAWREARATARHVMIGHVDVLAIPPG